MHNLLRTITGALLAILSLVTATAHAGQSCEQKKLSPLTVERGFALAQQTAAELDASGQQVVILARAGQDLRKYGLAYSHLGFAYRQPTTGGGHVWRIVHKLNTCGTGDAALYRQGLGEFFLDDLWRLKAAYVVPGADTQARLLPLLQDDRQVRALNQRAYSMVSYVWGTRYQQSNQWAIEFLARSQDPGIRTRRDAQAWLQDHDYQPSILTIGAMTRLGGRLSAANIAFDDHPPEKRFSDRIETVGVDSVFRWTERTGLSGAPVVIELQR